MSGHKGNENPPAPALDVVSEAYRRGIYDAKCWLRDQQHKNPPDSLWHAAAILADRMDVALLSSPSEGESAPASSGAGGALREALEGMVAIAQAWEAADSRKNIQLEHSNAYKAALRTLNLPLTGWIVWDGQSVPSVDRRDSRKGFIWFTHETEREAIERGQSEIFYWPWYGEDEQPCVRAYALATPLSHDAEGESATVSREGELREALQMAQEVRDLLLERIQGSPARSAAHNARVRADSLIMLLSSIIPAAQEDYPDPCPVCSGDCSSANPPVMNCPMKPHKEATPATSTERGR